MASTHEKLGILVETWDISINVLLSVGRPVVIDLGLPSFTKDCL